MRKKSVKLASHVVISNITIGSLPILQILLGVKVGPPVHNYEHEAGSYGDGFT